MASLGQLSERRIESGVSRIIEEFAPGQSLPRKLLDGRDRALATIRQYVPEFRYDVAEAEQAMREIDAWSERNEQALSAAMASTIDVLPEQLQLTMGSERTQAFILSSFTQAAAGLGPWTSGAVAREAERGDRINDRWARADAADRMEVFATIIKMDRDGHLRPIFVPPPGGTQGLGALPAWLIVVAIVVMAAAVVVLVLGWRRITLNNRLMRDICADAAERGDEETLRHCIEATRDLQVPTFEGVGKAFAGQLAWGLVAAGGIYALLKYGLPAAKERMR